MTASKKAAVEAPATEDTPQDPATHIKIDTTRNVHQRMVVAMRVIEETVFQKTQDNGKKPLRNGQQPDDSYNSVPIDAMRAAVRRACIEAGLVHIGFIDLEYKLDLRTAKWGGTLYHYEGTATFRYANADDPSDYIDFFAAGESNDSGDKALGKMLTNILKSHYKQAWDIGEHGRDDVDSYSNEEMEDEAARIAERRAKRAEAVRNDPFYSKPVPVELPDQEVVDLRKRVGAYLMMGEPFATIIQGHKAVKPFAEWDRAMLESVLAECEAAKGAVQ